MSLVKILLKYLKKLFYSRLLSGNIVLKPTSLRYVTFLFFLQYKVFEHYSDLNLDDEIIGFCESDFVELKLHLF